MPKRGGKRTKKRTHVTETEHEETAEEADGSIIPRTIVIRAPRTKLSHPMQVLQGELRKVMMPYTAEKLKEKKYNTLKDYTHVAGLLKVTHLMLLAPGGQKVSAEDAGAFSSSSPSSSSSSSSGSKVAERIQGAGALLKIARIPQGPTLTLRIEQYSLMRQVRATQKRSHDTPALYDHPPLVVLNNFGSSDAGDPSPSGAVPVQVKLMRITFQKLFPPTNVATVRLADCRRVALFHYDKEQQTVEMRHYAIRATPTSVSRPVKRVLQASSKELPDLGHLDDISDWLLGTSREGGGGGMAAGDASDSEAEGEEVVLPQRVRGRGNQAGQTCAMKLSELGPRLRMKLFKVERGVCDGDVLVHGVEKKTAAEVSAQRKVKAETEALKKRRRDEQEANVQRKQAALDEKRAAKRARREAREAALAARGGEDGKKREERGGGGGDGDDEYDDDEDEEADEEDTSEVSDDEEDGSEEAGEEDEDEDR
jgi:ribosome biogenesis protein SSF1/2